MTSLHPLAAELVVEPAPTATAVAWRLSWHITIGEGVHGAGPAGPAHLQLRDGGAVIWTDYADPDRLLQLDVPFGVVDGPGDDESLLARGRIHDADAEVVDRMVGSAIRERIVRAQQPIFSASVSPLDSWLPAGRAALVETMLAERSQPLVGLWAIEMERLLDRLGAGRSCERRRRDYAAVGAPAARVLPASLLTAVEGINDLADLLRKFAHRNNVDGPLLEALHESAATAVIAAAEADVDAAAREDEGTARIAAFRGLVASIDDEDHVGDMEPSFLGGPSRRPEPVCLRDHSVDGIVSSVDALLHGEELEVKLGLVAPVVGAARRLDVRVTGPDGLVAAAVSCEPLDGRRLRARLVLPTGTAPEELVVVVGRGLPFAPLDRDAFDERQAVARTRHLVDVLRAGSGSPPVDRERSVAAWRDAGRPDHAAAVEDLKAQPPFVTESTADALLPQIVDVLRRRESNGAGEDEAAAARDLCWSLGDLSEAARFEGQRRRLPDAPPLPIEYHDALVLALLASGDPQRAQRLDEQTSVPD